MHAKNGDEVRIIQTDIEDKRPVVDIVWTDESYREVYEKARLNLIKMHKPLAKKTEPYRWVIETKIVPWVVHVLRNK